MHQRPLHLRLPDRVPKDEKARRQEERREEDQGTYLRRQIPQAVALEEGVPHPVQGVGHREEVRDRLKPGGQDGDGEEDPPEELRGAHEEHVDGVAPLEDHDKAGGEDPDATEACYGEAEDDQRPEDVGARKANAEEDPDQEVEEDPEGGEDEVPEGR